MSIFFILKVLHELLSRSAAIEQIPNLNLPSIDSGAEDETVALMSLLEFEFQASITLAPKPLNIPITKDSIVVTK
jgi:hypothetical protein